MSKLREAMRIRAQEVVGGGMGRWHKDIGKEVLRSTVVRTPVTEMSNLELLIPVASPTLTYSLYISHAGPGRNPVS